MPMFQQNNLVSFDSQRSLTSSSSSSINNSRKATTLDTKLAILKSEMVCQINSLIHFDFLIHVIISVLVKTTRLIIAVSTVVTK